MFVRTVLFCFVQLSLPAILWAALPHFEIIDSEGNRYQGPLSAADLTRITVTVQGTPQTIPLDKVITIRNLAPNPYGVPDVRSDHDQMRTLIPMASRSTMRGENERRTAAHLAALQAHEQSAQQTFPNSVIVLELKEGSRLIVSSLTVANNQGTFRLLNGQDNVVLPLNAISAVRFAVRNLSESVNPSADWQRLTVPNAEGDRLVVGNTGSYDVYTGILHEISTDTISFAIDGEILPVPRRKVFGLVLHNESPLVVAPPLGTLALWAGTKAVFSEIHLIGNELTWTTSSGLTAAVPLDAVDKIDFGEKKMTYLTDFEWIRSEFSFPFESETTPEQFPLLQTFYTHRTKNASHIAVLDGTVYERSIVLYGKTQLEYLLPKPFTALKAIIGIEDQFRPYAAATLQILADSQMLGTWTLRGDGGSERIQVNLPQHCRSITIIAEPPAQFDLPAVITIAEPKLFE